MKLSAILTTHDWSRVGYLLDCIEQIDADEIVVVLDDRQIADVVETVTDSTVVLDESVECLSEARNAGAEAATGDVYAFLDDDVVTSSSWRDSLENAYEHAALAAGGPAVPIWPDSERPSWLPKEWDWLVGCGPYYDTPCEVRNTYGCNISFKATIFDELGGFDTAYGMRNDLTQGEETELCHRLNDSFDVGVEYRPGATVYHRVEEEQLNLSYLVKRAYEQGKTKARLGIDDDESDFLRTAISTARHYPKSSLFLSAVGLGFTRGLTSRRFYNQTS